MKKYANHKIRFIIKTCMEIAEEKMQSTKGKEEIYYEGMYDAFLYVHSALSFDNFKGLKYFIDANRKAV